MQLFRGTQRFVVLALSLFSIVTAVPATARAGAIDPRVLHLHSQLTRIYELRGHTRDVYNRLNRVIRSKRALNGDDLESIDELTKSHSAFAKELKAYIERGQQFVPRLPLQMPQVVDLAIALTASLTFVDSVDQVILLFESNSELRGIINQPNPSYARPNDVLYDALKDYYSVGLYRLRAAQIDAFEFWKNQPLFKNSPELKYLSEVIVRSPTYQRYVKQTSREREREVSKIRKAQIYFKATKLRDESEDFLTRRVVGGASKAIGNAVGAIQFRKGRLYGNMEIAAKMRAILKPGDLILDATPFRATAWLIPGHYGHVAMWVGNEWELELLGLRDEPLLSKHMDKIHKGHSILEALRTGVTLNPIEKFLDIDDLLILRPNGRITPEQIKRAILRGMSHMGQKYDFNFDNYSQDTIVCSELAFATYKTVPFRQEKTMGRWTISPDAVAAEALSGGWFTPVMMVQDGRVVEKNLDLALQRVLTPEAFEWTPPPPSDLKFSAARPW